VIKTGSPEYGFEDWGEAELLRLGELLLADTARGDGPEAVAAFGELVFGVRPAAHHLDWITKKLAHRRVVIVAPPESAKTTWSIILMAWSIGKRPWTTNMFVSATEKLAHAMAQAVADCIEFNPRWRMVFPDVVPARERGWSREGYEVVDRSMESGAWLRLVATKKDPSLISGGVGSASVNGRRVTGRLECDDIHDRESKTSDTVCQDTVGFMKDTVLSRVTEEGYLGMEQTRWNVSDSVAYLKGLVGPNGEAMYAVFEHPALVDGESYWPARWPVERLERKRVEVGEDWELVYQGNAEAARNQILKLESLRYYPAPNLRKEWDRYIGVDFTQRLEELTGNRQNDPDYFALAVWVNTHEWLVLEDGYRDRVSMGEAEEVFFQWADLKKPVRSAVEVNAAAVNFYSNLLKRMNTRGGPRHVIVPVTTTRNKAVRMSEMEPYFRTGQLRLSDEDNRFLRVFKAEWAGFGNRGVHDDTLDAAYLGWHVMTALLPTETREQVEARREKQAKTVAVTSAIERAYWI